MAFIKSSNTAGLVVMYLLVFSCSEIDQQEVFEPSKSDTLSLFTLTDPQETGLFFINEVNENEQLNILTYEYLYNGGGVAIGDINNDGLPDVFLSGNLFGGRLFLNKGDLKFEQISESAGVFQEGWSTGVSMVDINEDGYDDIYICRSLALQPKLRANVLLINNQDNTFTDQAAAYGLADESFSNHASFFDYDNDGDLDMYLLNHRIDFKEALKLKYTTNKKGEKVKYKEAEVDYTTDKLYRNDGNGTFTDVTIKAGLINRAFGLSVTTSDIDKDGWIDIYVANDYADKDHFYINNGDGTFTDKIEDLFFHMSKNAMGSDIADVNNDGLADVITLDMMAEGNQRQKLLKGQEPYDLYHTAVKYGLGHQVMRNTLQLNNGNGTFSEIGQLAGISHTDWSWSPLFADFDNDGFKDLFITNGLYRDITDLDFRNYTSPDAVKRFGGDVAGHALELTQLMKSTPVPNYIYRNEGDLTFSNKSDSWGINQPVFSNGAVYADMDLDGDLDLITNNFNSEAFLYRNNSLDNHYLTIALEGSKGNPDGVGAKVILQTAQGLQYQEASPYRGYLSSGTSKLHFGLGSENQVTELKVEWPGGGYQVLRNVKTDQLLTLSIDNAVVDSHKALDKTSTPFLSPVQNTVTQKHLHREDDFNDFKREALLEHALSNKGPFSAKGDINGDGLEDLYIGGSAGFGGSIYLQTITNGFEKIKVPDLIEDALYEDAQALFLDVDNDEDLDLIVTSGGYGFAPGAKEYQNRLYINNGNGEFKKSLDILSGLKANSTAIVALDFDSDGDLDLFIAAGAKPMAYPYADQSQLLINENGKFRDASNLLPQNGDLGMINAALAIDIDKDGSVEILLAGEWMPITVLNYTGAKFEIEKIDGLDQSNGWWNTLTAADMDGDGDLDLIGGNRGENSYYSASLEKPARIYAKDFDNNGRIDAFPFYYFNDGVSHPKHTLDEIAKQYPAIRKRFKRYTSYSTAGVTDFFSPDVLKEILILEANSFATTYFENLGNGSFNTQPLPSAAQFSEVHGILSKDINRDGNPDLIITGNNYRSDIESGRNDASIGCILLGDGKGDFKPMSTSESGFSVPGDTRGVFQIGDQVLVMVNNGTPYGFEFSEAH